MFTGIITAHGTLKQIDKNNAACSLQIDLDCLAAEAQIGDSIAVNGCCLTITSLNDAHASFDVSNETLAKTTIATWSIGRRVNLESALRMGDKLGGHMVSGHVDGLGKLIARHDQADSSLLRFALPSDGCVQIVEKGSICIDGISLTCFNLQTDAQDPIVHTFEVAVIPHTLAVTTLGSLSVDQAVHMEQDLVGRWVASLMPQSKETVTQARPL